MKKIIILIICLITSLCITGCKESEKEKLQREYEEYVKQFDTSSEKKEDAYGKYYSDMIVRKDQISITTRVTKTYPLFKLEYIGIDCAVGFYYLLGPKPYSWYYEEENKHLLEKYQQYFIVFLDEEKDMDELIDIIQKVHDLEFVQYADFVCDYEVGL